MSRRIPTAAAALALGMLFTWACGSDDDNAGSSPTPQDDGSAPLGPTDAAGHDVETATDAGADVDAEDARFAVDWDANEPDAADAQVEAGDGGDHVVQIALSKVQGTFACALMASGTVRCWGSNTGGELGDGTTTNRTTPVAVLGLTDAVSVTLGYQHACALRADHTVMCWGTDSRSQLGDGHGINDGPPYEQHSPVAVPGLLATQLAAGVNHTCARRASGTVVCWGVNDSGQLGDGTTTTSPSPVTVQFNGAPGIVLPVAAIDLEDAVEVSAGFNHSCARRANGTVLCWGQPEADPTTVAALTNVAQVSAGFTNTCVRFTNQTVSCWGDNSSGKSGSSDFFDGVLTPTAVAGLTGVTQISLGFEFTCATLASGGARCLGADGSSQLGDGLTTDTNVPATVKNVTNAVEVASGGSSACARLATGSVVCWGDNSFGQLGDGTTVAHAAPAAVHGLN